MITPLITTPYISRILHPDGVGIYSYTNSVAQYFIILGSLGINTYGQMEIAKTRNDSIQCSKTFWEIELLRVFTTMLSLLIYVVISLNAKNYRTERLIYIILIIASLFDFSWFFRGIEDFSKITIRNFVIRLLMTGLIFIVIKDENDVNLYILLIAITALLGNISFLFALSKYITIHGSGIPNIFKHLKQTIIYFIPSIAISIYTIMDKTMLGVLTHDINQNGFYEQAHKIEQILLVIITSFNTIMRSRMSYLFSTGRIDEMKEKLKSSLSFVFAISIPMTIGVFFIAPRLIPIFLGDGFQESIVLVRIFSILLVIIGLSNCINTNYLSPIGRQSKNNFVLITGALINLVLNLILIPRFGAIGAAIASVIAEFIILIGYMNLSRDMINIYMVWMHGKRAMISGMIMLISLIVADDFVQNSILGLIELIICGVLVYSGMLVVLKDPIATYILKQLGDVK